MSAPPSHISLAPPQLLGAFSMSPTSSPSPRDNPFDSPPLSPALSFFTAPSTPIPSPHLEDPPPQPPPPQVDLYVRSPSPPRTDHRVTTSSSFELETIPPLDALSSPDFSLDFTLDDEGLSTLEKIYLFCRSKSAYHRVFIAHALHSFLELVTPLEAVEYVLPLLPGLAIDEDETVKEALASELVKILWWFLTHCRLVEEPADHMIAYSSPDHQHAEGETLISVQAFTPVLGTLLLSPNGMVSSSARYAVVEVLRKMRQMDELDINDEAMQTNDRSEEIQNGVFGPYERNIFEEEIVQQIIIGMGRLDTEDEEARWVSDNDSASGNEVWYDAGAGERSEGVSPACDILASNDFEHDSPMSSNFNPYFPAISSWPAAASPVQPSISQVPPALNALSTRGIDRGSDNQPMTALSFVAETVGSSTDPWVSTQGPQPEAVPCPTHVDDDPMELSHEQDNDDDEIDPSEQAAVGRLSSMSLIAAVTAGGTLREETKTAFVREVERVGRDSIYWVRREASFALGALAKVVPAEVAVFSLLPLFESLRSDPVWHVRHSSLFALPALLSRLSPAQRRAVSLASIVPLSRDESAPVRSGVLEALGEVVYTFHEDEDGPPHELLRLFLGREEDRRAREAQQQNPSPQSSGSLGTPTLDPFYDDPARPLACAFNIPAVALTLGRARWGELRALFLTLAQNRSIKVRRTLAASLGELAKVIGPEHAQRDLIGVWWDAMRCEEESDIRMKAIEGVQTFVMALGHGEGRDTVMKGLLDIWEEGWLRKWREREGVVKALITLDGAPGRPEVISQILKKGLEDAVGGVREAAIMMVYQMSQALDVWKHIFDIVWADILAFAEHPSHRKRMTFVACQQALVFATQSGKSVLMVNDMVHWRAFSQLANDHIIGVRIGVARLTGIICYKLSGDSKPVPQHILDLVKHLLQDSCQENRYRTNSVFPTHVDTFLTFSRPPPPSEQNTSSDNTGQDPRTDTASVNLIGQIQLAETL
ncbi:hypothetical protein SERLADRAFT_410491 [Serpula lacrymans var. lacrymans S7.9]|uniref:TOG domain-containing protein n=1 Tax=Serpula lacrymans var. lacrymans (strain S7.9) TaxID=578457 RepID=F8P661_SERL9|nr:uncharacterized protein SERLADRAFT_410491 [Serpula lacrymans var. lacrymans S7.9]EGO20928.1 hypothetical protein SERLADRAFT_410491 [Serpula lacrymans var. lacrymans S7.9]